MNILKHCQISVKRWGGQAEDYIEIHRFIDQTKALCPDMRHRIFHTHWAIDNLVIPIFGESIKNSNGEEVCVRDMCERDHFLVDFHNKFIPTLNDFVSAIDESRIPDLRKRLDHFYSEYGTHNAIAKLMLSPLAHTGQVKSLLITHNSWFINSIIPQILETKTTIKDFNINPATLYEAMNLELWMDNGLAFPQSAKQREKHLVRPI